MKWIATSLVTIILLGAANAVAWKEYISEIPSSSEAWSARSGCSKPVSKLPSDSELGLMTAQAFREAGVIEYRGRVLSDQVGPLSIPNCADCTLVNTLTQLWCTEAGVGQDLLWPLVSATE